MKVNLKDDLTVQATYIAIPKNLYKELNKRLCGRLAKQELDDKLIVFMWLLLAKRVGLSNYAVIIVS